MSESPAFNSLIDMGISPVLAQAAIRNLKTQDISALLDWISDHSGEGEEQKWSKWLEENKEEKSEGNQAGKSISHLVNQEFVQELISKSHSKVVAEKSLLLTGNTSVASAEAWIQQHKYDQDFQEQLQLEGQAFQESTLTDEEAKIKLKELTEKARQNRRKREEEDQREREKNRLRYGKEMIQAKRIAEQQAVKRQLELDRIQKRKDEEYKKQLVEQMRRQRNEKLGIKDDGKPTKVEEKEEKKPKLNMLQQLEVQCEQVKVGMHAYPDRAKVFFQTAQIYVNNIIKNNGQEKFRKINLENKAFKTRIAECFGGVQTLEVLGYQEEGGFLVMKNYDLGTLSKAQDIFGRYKAFY